MSFSLTVKWVRFKSPLLSISQIRFEQDCIAVCFSQDFIIPAFSEFSTALTVSILIVSILIVSILIVSILRVLVFKPYFTLQNPHL
jgi:hypothetical protein